MRVFLVVLFAVSTAHADPPASLAWSLRPVAPGTVIRIDSVAATFTDQDARGETYASVLTVSTKATPRIAPLVRVALLSNTPATGEGATGISNPVVGVVGALPVPAGPWKVGVFGGLALPIGSGGGNSGDPARAAAEKATMLARSAMDNAMFAVNDLTPIVGLDVAYVARGLTVQAESTLFELVRVRGDAVQKDAYKTNFTTGLHAGYSLLPWLCASAELRYQRYLTTPVAVAMNPDARDNLTVAVGLRGLVKLAAGQGVRPGISLARGLDLPMASRGYSILQLDLPFAF